MSQVAQSVHASRVAGVYIGVTVRTGLHQYTPAAMVIGGNMGNREGHLGLHMVCMARKASSGPSSVPAAEMGMNERKYAKACARLNNGCCHRLHEQAR